MKFRFPIVIIDEDFRSENTSGLGIRALAQAIESDGFEVLGVTSIVITHELDSAFEIADKMVVLRKGNEKENEYWGPARMVAQGNREEITSCIHPHVIEFLEVMSYHRDMPLARYHKNWYSGICEAS